jgi:N-acetyl sugar amidotransferase
MKIDIPKATERQPVTARITPPRMSYCSRCCYPIVAATPISLDRDMVCSGCRTYDEQRTIDWTRRERMFRELCDEYRSTDGKNYDCLIPVSGGKDSFYQIHLLKRVYGMNPLLVTYNENNETDVGRRNIQRMKEVFGCDYINVTPSIAVLKKMNRVGLRKMGDPDMHAHMGINSVPVQMAVKHAVPLVIWGEHGFMNLGGMHSFKDMVEYTSRYRKEHLLRGYDWEDFVGEDGLTERDLLWAKYPDDATIERLGIRGIFISNYFGWDQNKHTQMMIDLYGFEVNPQAFDRTYKRDSNLNNIHDNGIHDYMKYVKFGYGRVVDHVCRDIRCGAMTRAEGIALIRQYDHVVPGDIGRWLEYVGMTRVEFEEIADRFRDPRVWVKNEYGQWIKDNIWDHN